MLNRYCMTRTKNAGVFAGTVAKRDGQEITLTDALRAYERDEHNGEVIALKRRIAELEATVAAAAKNEERLLIEAQEGSDQAGKMHARIDDLLRENDALFNQVEAYEDIGLSLRGRIAVMSGPTPAEQARDEMAQECAA